ncbi:MAG TPA: response regulator [Candidatus Parcubacteria bacterium]|nr:response regulator [Candidatus Parcubacteria bacterium]
MKKILLVEDDPFLIEIYTSKLKEAGFSVSVVTSGELVLEKVEEEKPDLVLLDVVLPNMDGWEILQAIKTNPKVKETRVVILSNLGEKEDVEKGIKLGAVKYLIKSHYTPSEVVEEIKNLFN